LALNAAMMATIALSRPIAPHRSSSTISSLASAITLDNIPPSQPSQCPAAVPNKHIPVCPPGPIPQEEPTTPPPSPGKEEQQLQQSLLFPPNNYTRIELGRLSVYKISPAHVAAALDYRARQPLADPSRVFPWLHGLHPANQIQQAFFIARKRALRKTPSCLRGIAVVKADGDLNVARLKGAIAPHEFLQLGGAAAEFLEVDPKEGFSVRNFQIQAAKSAMTSDIIVYGDDDATVRKLGWDIAAAQQRWRDKHEAQRQHLPKYNTFICVTPFAEFEEKHPEIVSVNSDGQITGNVLDFFHQERREMYEMTRASEISHNVWLGPTPDPGSEDEQAFDVLIECSDLGRLNPGALRAISEGADIESGKHFYVDFPSSGSILAPTWSHAEADGILETCKWIWHLAHGTHPSVSSRGSTAKDSAGDGDIVPMLESPDCTLSLQLRPRRILIHCADGYTESSMLGIAYYSFSTGKPVPEAWLDLHTTKGRNFFAYPSDVALLTSLTPRLLQESPARPDGESLSDITALARNEPSWFGGFDGSFPSRILDYMYLGNLGHANNPDLLRALGIGQILSVGETAMWRDGELEEWGVENTCVVKGVQDNGIDPLTDEFGRCLEFIGAFLCASSPIEWDSLLTCHAQTVAAEMAPRPSSTAASVSRAAPPSASLKSCAAWACHSRGPTASSAPAA
jgi:dual specificity MAP kinase phosphatase